MFNKGDYVVHLGFPEVYGKVNIIIPMPDNKYKIGVWVDDFTGGRIFYDMDDKWEIDMNYPPEEQETVIVNDTYDTSDIVEADYKVIE